MQDIIVKIGNSEYKAVFDQKNPSIISVNEKIYQIERLKHYIDFIFSYSVNNRIYQVEFDFSDDSQITVNLDGFSFDITITDETKKLIDMFIKQSSGGSLKGLIRIKAPMPGLLIKSYLEEGKEFKKGENLMIIEAMKMENSLKAPCDSVVRRINIQEGMAVEKDTLLVELEG